MAKNYVGSETDDGIDRPAEIENQKREESIMKRELVTGEDLARRSGDELLLNMRKGKTTSRHWEHR